MERVKQLAAHLTSSSQFKGRAALESKNPDDVVITMAIRSPLCKATKGGFRDARSATNSTLIPSDYGLHCFARTDELMLEIYKVLVDVTNVEHC